MCGSRRGGAGSPDPPRKSQKYRFFSNTGPDPLKDTYFVIYGIISEFTDKGNFTSLPGQFQYLTLLRGLQGGLTCKFDQGLSTAKNLSIGCYFA